MNLTGSHVAGGSLGALLAIILVALGKRIGLVLTDGESAAGAIALLGLGAGIGHAARQLYTVGLIPFFSGLLHGTKTK